MIVLDQTQIGAFFLQLHGPRPCPPSETAEYAARCEEVSERIGAGDLSVLENEAWFPRASMGAARDGRVEAPTGWSDPFGLLEVQSLDASGALLLGKILPITATSVRKHLWCVWNRSDGRLLWSSTARGAAWAESLLLEAGWCDDEDGEKDDYWIRLVEPRAGRVVVRRSFDIPANTSKRMSLSAQSLDLLRSPAHWLVWHADGHGGSAFHVVRVDGRDGLVERLFASDASPWYEDQDSPPVTLSPDGSWLAYFASVSLDGESVVTAAVRVALRTGSMTAHRLSADTWTRLRSRRASSGPLLEIDADGALWVPGEGETDRFAIVLDDAIKR